MVVLLPKDGVLSCLSNWRPITLLNVDRKIIAKIFASRLSLAAPDFISECQTGAIRNRDVSATPRYLSDVISHLGITQSPGIMLKMDLRKAYDHVDWHFLLHTLSAFGFGKYFLTWMEILLTQSSTAIKVNGFVTDFFRIGRSLRQGCPLSPLLYTLSTEPLCLALTKAPHISRLFVAQTFVPTVFQHVDDNTLMLSSESSITEVIKIYDAYGSASGAVINIDKSRGQWLGSWSTRGPTTIAGVHISSTPVKILGLFLTNDRPLSDSLNWEPPFLKISATLRAWKRRKLSLFGKIIILNTLAVSKLWHLARVLPVPVDFFDRVKESFLSFLWGSGMHLVSYDTLTRLKICGGFGLVDIALQFSAFRLRETHAYITGSLSCHDLAIHTVLLQEYGGGLLPPPEQFRVPFKKSWPYNTPLRYVELLLSWQTYLQCENVTVTPHTYGLNEPIFGNSAIPLPQSFMPEMRLLASSGFTRLRDLHYEVRPGFLRHSALLDQCHLTFPYEELNPSRIMELYTILQGAIPLRWRTLFRHPVSPSVRHAPLLCLSTATGPSAPLPPSKVRDLYLKLRSRPAERSVGETRWHDFFIAPLPPISYCRLANCLLGASLSTLNYQVIHRAFPLKTQLLHAGLVSDNLCLVCNCAPETVDHLFLLCPKVVSVWQRVFDVLCIVTQCPIFTYNNDRIHHLLIIYHKMSDRYGFPSIMWTSIFVFFSVVKREIWTYRCRISISAQIGSPLSWHPTHFFRGVVTELHSIREVLLKRHQLTGIYPILGSFISLLC